MAANSTSEKLRHLFFGNPGLKLTAVVIAVIVWLAVSSAPHIEVAFNVPVEFRNVSDDLEVTSESIPQAEVRLRGPSRVIRELKISDLHVSLNLANFPTDTSGERTFNLSPDQVRVPTGVEVLQVVPSSLRLSFDKRAQRQVAIRARVIGTLAPGYKIASIAVDPSAIGIVGPKQHLSAVDAAMTDPIDATGVIGSHTFLASAHVQDPLVRFAQPAAVRVTVTTERK
jgi:YbbR domain-containing protein